MLTVYKYDPKTRRPVGAHECRIDPNSDEPMRPRYSLDAPPPAHPDFVEVLAGDGVWWVDVEATRENCLNKVKEAHEDILVQLSGGASVAERDTWPNQKDWTQALKSSARWIVVLETLQSTLPDTFDDLAPVVEDVKADILEASSLLSGLLTGQEIASLEAGGVSPSEFMASKVMGKVKAMNALITTATRLKRAGEVQIASADSLVQIAEIMSGLEAEATAASQLFASQS